MRRALPLLLMMLPACNRAPTAQAQATPPTVSADLAPVPPPRATFVPTDIPRIDVHTHIELGALEKAVALARRHGVVHLVNLSGGSPGGDGLEDTLAEAKRVGHTTV